MDWPRDWSPYTRAAVVAVVLAALSWGGWLLYDAGYFARDTLTALALDAGPWAWALLAGALFLAVVVGPIPTVPITIACGLILGPVAGFALAWASALTGAAASFWLARLAGRPLVERLAGQPIAFYPGRSERMLFWIVLGCRLVPVISFALVSYGAGLTPMTARAFLLATGVGMIPMTALFIAVGAAATVDPLWAALGGLLAVAIVVGAPWLIDRYDLFGLRAVLRGEPANPVE